MNLFGKDFRTNIKKMKEFKIRINHYNECIIQLEAEFRAHFELNCSLGRSINPNMKYVLCPRGSLM